MQKTGIDKLDYYTSGVASGEIDVCKWVRLAVERHYKDLDRQRSEGFPYYFEPLATMHYVNFFADNLCHFDGVWKGKPVIFEPWQYFAWGSPFGWLNIQRVQDVAIRRYKEIIIIIPKKQGKTLIIAGTMLYMLDYDGWPGSQIFTLALDQTQAKKLGYGDAVKLVKNSPTLADQYRINRGAGDMGIYCDANDSQIRPSISDAEKMDGVKVHMSANDEVKDWDNFAIYKTMKQNQASDPNALTANTTTAGSDMTSLGYDLEDKMKKILDGTIIDESTFGMIYTLDNGEIEEFKNAMQHRDAFKRVEHLIKKANPNYGIAVVEDYYRKEIADAQKNARDMNDFLTKHLDIWINAMSHYFNMQEWQKCEVSAYSDWQETFAHKPCYVFIDLQSKKDICPMYALFPNGSKPASATNLMPDTFTWKEVDYIKTEINQDTINYLARYKELIEQQWIRPARKKYAVFGVNFLPRYVVSENLVGKRSSYNAWAETGYFHLTEGKTTDYDVVLGVLRQWKKKFNIQSVGLDDWGPHTFANDVERLGLETVIIKQNTKMLSDPMKTLDAWITEEQINHAGDPVLFWAMSNVVAKEDANKNVYPRKEHPDNKIDPAVALINLLAMELEFPLPRTTKKRVPKVWTI